MKQPRMLAAFYSRTGNTRKVSESISGALRCDSEEIFDTKNRAGAWGFLSTGFDATFNRLTVIKEIKKDPSTHNLVIVGTPIWNASLSCPIIAYLYQNKQDLNSFAFFCTYDGRGSDRVFGQMEKACAKKPLGLLAVTSKDVKRVENLSKVKAFVEDLCRKLAYIRFMTLILL